jgi:hypothetical protein
MVLYFDVGFGAIANYRQNVEFEYVDIVSWINLALGTDGGPLVSRRFGTGVGRVLEGVR